MSDMLNYQRPIGERKPRPISHDSHEAKVNRYLNPDKGYCGRCGFTWDDVHVTEYDPANGCFPLCEPCWKLLGCGEARIEYYKELIDFWEQDVEVSEETKFNIMKAVANGG